MTDQNDENTDDTTEDHGIPVGLRVKRGYNMSEMALQQRRDAAKQPKPGMLGKRNNFKHGRYAVGFANRLRPCLSTCSKYPCVLVEDGACAPGDDCLDVAAVLDFFRAVNDAVKAGGKGDKADNFKELASLQISNSMRILEMLQEDIMRDGTVLKRETPTANGLKTEYVQHPSLNSLTKLISDLGITAPEFLITARSMQRADTDEKSAEGVAGLMSKLGNHKNDPDEE
jgi:hypothetical protein